MFTWHFTILGPESTDFHEGIYHGQIVLPFEYPFKPPDIYFFTKNGRFEAQTKICLTITQYHPEEWNAAWTIRTMLEAVISLFNEHVPGVGYVESSSDTRKTLAKDSHSYVCEKCGPIKNILKIRKPMQIVHPTVLPKPIPFATHDIRKLSEAMLFSD
jgi:ubiquitin-conjugating enzyme E2 J1